MNFQSFFSNKILSVWRKITDQGVIWKSRALLGKLWKKELFIASFCENMPLNNICNNKNTSLVRSGGTAFA